MLDNLTGKGLIIHHWDTDGICSAALLMEQLQEPLDNITPTIGAFYLSGEEIRKAKGYDFVIIADMALPLGDISQIAGETRVIVFDHHHQDYMDFVEHNNPVAKGDEPENFPSCTWVIKDSLDLPLSIYVILGIIADRGHKIKLNPIFNKIVEDFSIKVGLKFEDLLELCEYIDSNYRVGDKAGVEAAPILLKEYESYKDIISNKDWVENKASFEAKLNEIIKEPPKEENGVLIKWLNTDYSLISSVTRKIAWGTGKDTIVINTGFFTDRDQVYCRSANVDMEKMISEAKRHGYNAGGKKDVLGAIIPKEHTKLFLYKLKKYLKKK